MTIESILLSLVTSIDNLNETLKDVKNASTVVNAVGCSPLHDMGSRWGSPGNSVDTASSSVVRLDDNEICLPPVENVKAPFTDAKGLMSYVMTSYKQMGAEKGPRIQEILTNMGISNVSDVTNDLYDVFFNKIESLKND